jgi:hypothetical protein
MEVTGRQLTCVQSAGNWNNTSNAGVWNSNWNNNRTNSNNNVGFACDCKASSSLLRQWNYRDCPFRHYAKSTDAAFLVGPCVSKTRRFQS